MANFTICVNGKGDYFRVHLAGCRDIKTETTKYATSSTYNAEAENVEAAIADDIQGYLDGSGGDQQFHRSDYYACHCALKQQPRIA